MRFVTLAVFGAVFGTLYMSGAALAGTPEGTWLSQDGATKVHVANCSGKLCGSVIWLKDPNDPQTGKAKTDKHNSNEAKRSRLLLGLQVVQRLSPDGTDTWSGQIYNADDGNTYQAHMKVTASNIAKVQGCVLGLLCKTQTWTRVN